MHVFDSPFINVEFLSWLESSEILKLFLLGVDEVSGDVVKGGFLHAVCCGWVLIYSLLSTCICKVLSDPRCLRGYISSSEEG